MSDEEIVRAGLGDTPMNLPEARDALSRLLADRDSLRARLTNVGAEWSETVAERDSILEAQQQTDERLEKAEHLLRIWLSNEDQPVKTTRDFLASRSEEDECPSCRSRTRTWRDKLWNDDRAAWIDCQDAWHDAQAGEG